MSSRTYSVEFHGVSISAIQDLIAIYCGSSKAIELHGVVIGQITGTTVQNLSIHVGILPSTVTAGSGGSTPTPQKVGDRNGTAATVTAHINDTVQATTSGTQSRVHSDVFNTVNGYQFFWPEEDRPTAELSEALVLSLDTAPASTLVMSGSLYFAELF